MQRRPWQIVTHWLSVDGSEYVQTTDCATAEEARAEAQRLCPTLGVMDGTKLLKGVQIVGDFTPQLFGNAR